MACNVCPDGPLGSRHVRRQGSRNRTPDIIYMCTGLLLLPKEENASAVAASSCCRILNNDKEEESLTHRR